MIMLWLFAIELDLLTLENIMMCISNQDIALLSDVFETFRKSCLTENIADLANYLSAPSLSWDARLFRTSINIDLMHTTNLLNMMERMKKGG